LSFYDQIIRRGTESLAINDYRQLEFLVRVVYIVRYAKKLKQECMKFLNKRMASILSRKIKKKRRLRKCSIPFDFVKCVDEILLLSQNRRIKPVHLETIVRRYFQRT
jgi:hypothetical protein